MIKKIITICFIILLLFTITGCLDEEKIKPEEEAQDAVMDVSEDISDTLESIDEDLG